MSKMLGMVYYIGIYNLHDMLSDAKKIGLALGNYLIPWFHFRSRNQINNVLVPDLSDMSATISNQTAYICYVVCMRFDFKWGWLSRFQHWNQVIHDFSPPMMMKEKHFTKMQLLTSSSFFSFKRNLDFARISSNVSLTK